MCIRDRFYGWIMPLWAIVVVPYLVLGMLPIGMFCIIFGLEFEFLERSVFDIFYWVTRLSLVALCIVFSPLILVYYIIAVYMGSAECPPLDYATRIYEKRKYLSSFKEQDKIDDKTTYRSESKRERIVRHYLTKKSRVEFFNENYLLPRLRSYSDNKILNFKQNFILFDKILLQKTNNKSYSKSLQQGKAMPYTTKKSLLEAIKNGCEVSWHEFYETYRPLILLRGGDFNLTEVEKKELVQLVLLEIFKGQKTFTYDTSKGRFRDYLRRIIGCRAIDIYRNRKKNVVFVSNLEQFPEENSAMEDSWDIEWHSHVLSQAMQVLRIKVEPQTYQAFELYVIEDMSSLEVALFLKISKNMVYVAKSRAMEHLKSILKELGGTHEALQQRRP
eukprot:TRINITY_DN9243_c0_g1_i5.p1 TRINITY_DN9243_c0_g1~~TRINITY_DN9243_c0_g1_i5.p1  ORF type:complete len:388 (-),score=17.53 TRINITY_DN9243_c0_g1_i5:183-1346(-)